MRIAFYGDSLTEGRPGAAFMPLLARRLPRHELVNRGRAGDTTADLLSRLRRDGVEDADLAVIWIGANDAFALAAGDWPAADGDWVLAGEDPPAWSAVLESVARAYERVLAAVAAAATRLLLVSPVAPDGDLGEPLRARFDDLRVLVEAAAAARPPARYVDLRPAFAAASGPFSIDGVHLNAAGAAVVARAFATAVEEEEERGSPGAPVSAR